MGIFGGFRKDQLVEAAKEVWSGPGELEITKVKGGKYIVSCEGLQFTLEKETLQYDVRKGCKYIEGRIKEGLDNMNKGEKVGALLDVLENPSSDSHYLGPSEDDLLRLEIAAEQHVENGMEQDVKCSEADSVIAKAEKSLGFDNGDFTSAVTKHKVEHEPYHTEDDDTETVDEEGAEEEPEDE